MGAAVPHLALFAVSILPYASDEIHTEILIGTVEVQDEVIPDDEDEDITCETRSKSMISDVINIGDGHDESKPRLQIAAPTKKKPSIPVGGSKRKQGNNTYRREPMQVVFQEPEQEDDEASESIW